MNRKELFEFVKEKSRNAKFEDEILGDLYLRINDHNIKMVESGQIFEKEKIAYFYNVNYSNPQLKIYYDNGITYFEYDELLDGFNGDIDFFILPRMK